MKFIHLTTYKQSDGYTPENSGLLLKNQFVEIETLINTDDIVQLLPKTPTQAVGHAVVILRGSMTAIPIKEKFEWLAAQLAPETSANS